MEEQNQQSLESQPPVAGAVSTPFVASKPPKNPFGKKWILLGIILLLVILTAKQLVSKFSPNPDLITCQTISHETANSIATRGISTTATLPFTITDKPNTLLMVTVGYKGNLDTIKSVKYGDTILRDFGGGGRPTYSMYAFYATSPPAGTAKITVEWNEPVQAYVVSANSFSGVNQSFPYSVDESIPYQMRPPIAGTTDIPSSTFTTKSANSLFGISVLYQSTENILVPISGTTETNRKSSNPDLTGMDGYHRNASPGTYQFGWVNNSSFHDFAFNAFELKSSNDSNCSSTADWKKYTNKDFGFSFIYPPSITVYPNFKYGVQIPLNSPDTIESIKTFADKKSYTINPNLFLKDVDTGIRYDGINILIYTNKQGLSPQAWAERYKNNLSEGYQYFTKQFYKPLVEPINLHTKEAIHITGYEKFPIDFYIFPLPKNKILIIHKMEKSKGSFTKFDQILSTFKFTDQNSKPTESRSIMQTYDKNTITIDFKKCTPIRSRVDVAFGSTTYEILGEKGITCIMRYGGEVENPNWDGKLTNSCSIPKNINQQTFNKNGYGVDFSPINKYCSSQ